MTSRSRWVVVRNEKEGKQWQLVFPDGRVLKTIPVDSIRASGGHGQEGERDGDAPAAGHDAGNPHRH